MPTTSSSRSSSSSTGSSGSSASSELADLLGSSQSATIYIDAELSDAHAAALLAGEPPLHAEHDLVRDKWAIRKATPEEVAEAQAAASNLSSSSTSSSTSVA